MHALDYFVFFDEGSKFSVRGPCYLELCQVFRPYFLTYVNSPTGWGGLLDSIDEFL